MAEDSFQKDKTMLRSFVLLVGAVTACTSLRAEETFELKSPVAKPGDIIKSVRATDSEGSFRIVDLKIDPEEFDQTPTDDEKQVIVNALNEQMKSVRESVVIPKKRVTFQDVILEISDNRITKRRRKYEPSSQDAKPGSPLPKSAVIIEQIGQRFSFYEEDGPEFVGEEAAALRADFNQDSDRFKDSDFLPKTPVMLREQWPINATAVAELFGQELSSLGTPIKPKTATGFGMLQRVYRQQERTYGVIVFTFQVPLNFSAIQHDANDKASNDAPERSKLAYLLNVTPEPGRIEFTITHDGPIDGTNGPTQMECRIKVEGDMPLVIDADFVELLARIDLTVTQTNRHSLVTK